MLLVRVASGSLDPLSRQVFRELKGMSSGFVEKSMAGLHRHKQLLTADGQLDGTWPTTRGASFVPTPNFGAQLTVLGPKNLNF